jgi:hypothetical protein
MGLGLGQGSSLIWRSRQKLATAEPAPTSTNLKIQLEKFDAFPSNRKQTQLAYQEMASEMSQFKEWIFGSNFS